MNIATITEAKNKLSALLDQVRAGESVLIVDRGRPVARLEPALSLAEDSEGRLSRLERSGIVRIAAGEPPIDVVMSKPPRPRRASSAVQALLEERSAGR